MPFCCVLASDSAFFHQAAAAIGSVRRALDQLTGRALDIAFVAINLQADQIDWLHAQGVAVHNNLADFPRFRDAPDHTVALTCRPYVPWIWPDYDGYLWVDSDIRFLTAEGLTCYLAALHDAAVSITAVQETEAAYSVHQDPVVARIYHSQRVARLLQVYGDEVTQYCQYFTPFNAGLFAARADSPFWARYRRNLDKALRVPFDGMLEQDALNVAMIEVGDWHRAPSAMNWLCSLRMPVRVDDGSWRHPDELFRPVCVAHLTNSTSALAGAGGNGTYFDLYRAAGLTV